MRRPTDPKCRHGSRLWLLPLCVVALGFAACASAVEVRGGDLLVLGEFGSDGITIPHRLVVVHPVGPVVEFVVPVPPLMAPRDLAVRASGDILVLDEYAGLLSMDPRDGTWATLAAAGAFAYGPPTAMMLTSAGDVLAAGSGAVYRLAGGSGPPEILSVFSFNRAPQGIACDGGSNAWVCDSGLVHVNLVSGGADRIALSAQGLVFPLERGLGRARWNGDGTIDVVSMGVSGRLQDRLNAGIYRVDVSTGASFRVVPHGYVESFTRDEYGALWMSCAATVHLNPFAGTIEDGVGLFWVVGDRGPIAAVPASVTTPARKSSWGALKRLYR